MFWICDVSNVLWQQRKKENNLRGGAMRKAIDFDFCVMGLTSNISNVSMGSRVFSSFRSTVFRLCKKKMGR